MKRAPSIGGLFSLLPKQSFSHWHEQVAFSFYWIWGNSRRLRLPRSRALWSLQCLYLQREDTQSPPIGEGCIGMVIIVTKVEIIPSSDLIWEWGHASLTSWLTLSNIKAWHRNSSSGGGSQFHYHHLLQSLGSARPDPAPASSNDMVCEVWRGAWE